MGKNETYFADRLRKGGFEELKDLTLHSDQEVYIGHAMRGLIFAKRTLDRLHIIHQKLCKHPHFQWTFIPPFKLLPLRPLIGLTIDASHTTHGLGFLPEDDPYYGMDVAGPPRLHCASLVGRSVDLRFQDFSHVQIISIGELYLASSLERSVLLRLLHQTTRLHRMAGRLGSNFEICSFAVEQVDQRLLQIPQPFEHFR